jgi:hypothetical protein
MDGFADVAAALAALAARRDDFGESPHPGFGLAADGRDGCTQGGNGGGAADALHGETGGPESVRKAHQ